MAGVDVSVRVGCRGDEPHSRILVGQHAGEAVAGVVLGPKCHPTVGRLPLLQQGLVFGRDAVRVELLLQPGHPLVQGRLGARATVVLRSGAIGHRTAWPSVAGWQVSSVIVVIASS